MILDEKLPENLCPECAGRGVIDCEACVDGTDEELEEVYEGNCLECSGEGSIKCANCDGEGVVVIESEVA